VLGSYQYDVNDRIIEMTSPGQGVPVTREFSYDDKHELIKVEPESSDPDQSYLYDNNFNRKIPNGTTGLKTAKADTGAATR
jgi:hypothetical protein